MRKPTNRDFAIALGINESAVPRLLEAVRRGGIQGGAPDGDDAAVKAAAEAKAKADADAKAKGDEAAALKARAEKAEADLAKKNEADAAAKKKLEDDEAKKRGDFDKLTRQKDDEIAALKARADRADALEKASKERIDAAIAKLPDAAKKEIELVKDSLTPEKLEALVALKGGDTSIPIPPAPGVGNRGGRKDGGYELNPVTVEVLDELYEPEQTRQTAKHLGSFMRGTNPVFRWQGTGNDPKDTLSFINMMNKIAYNPLRDMMTASQERLFGKAGA